MLHNEIVNTYQNIKTNVNTKETSLINILFKRDITIFDGLAGLVETINSTIEAVVGIIGFIICLCNSKLLKLDSKRKRSESNWL